MIVKSNMKSFSKLMTVNQKQTNQSGQMLVILLLIMIVGLTVGLFLVSRTTGDISISTNLADSSRAFNAAEAGIEEAIRNVGTAGSAVEIASGVTYEVSTQDLGGAAATIYPETLTQATKLGDALTVWLVPHDASGNLNIVATYLSNTMRVCFTGGSVTPTIGVTLYYFRGSSILGNYTGYDPDSRANGFNAAQPNSGQCPSGYNYTAAIDFSSHFGVNPVPPGTDILVALRLRPVYADSTIAVIPDTAGGGVLAKQGESIDSVGKAGETARRIVVGEPYTEPVPFLDHVLYSTNTSTNIEK